MFKVGDRVKLKEGREWVYLHVKKGETYTIESINEKSRLKLKEVKEFNDYEKDDFELVKEENKKEAVNHPSHYNKGIESIDIIESWDLNFSLGNAIKYILRAPHKNNQLEDLKKAQWYVTREIEKLEKIG